jgi:hypothetical protein
MTLRLGSIKTNCPIGDVLIRLNCCKVSADNSYKVFKGKYKTTSILKNVCPGKWPISRTIPNFFHYVLTQEWGRATKDYKKFVHKKLSFNMARKKGSGVPNLIFFHQLPL